MNLAFWDIESSSAITDFGSIIEIGGILVDEKFEEKDRFNLLLQLKKENLSQEKKHTKEYKGKTLKQ